MADHIALLRMADPSIPWPEKADTELVDRPGWTRQAIQVDVRDGWSTVEALMRREFAVHRMINDEGFATTFVANGKRIHCGGMVWARCIDAMKAVEELQRILEASVETWAIDWCALFYSGAPIPPSLQSEFVRVHKEAERAGKIMLNTVTQAR